ncbi:MAG: 6-phosphogluconolactonase [Meiothermus sp.]|nr:6-phosphogluconolactonase [Meiothermus sp.]
MNYQIHRFPDAQAASEALAQLLSERLSAGGRAVLAGGGSALKAYALFGRADILWSRVQFIVSDERCVAPDHPDRNERAIREAIGRSKVTFHAFPAEMGAAAAAEGMEATMQGLIPFDVVVLGLGEDAHTASLFPGRDLGFQTLVAPVLDSPKPPPERVTLTPKALSSTQLVVYMVTGEGKREALQRVLSGEDVPPNHITAPEVLIFCDAAALPEGVEG